MGNEFSDPDHAGTPRAAEGRRSVKRLSPPERRLAAPPPRPLASWRFEVDLLTRRLELHDALDQALGGLRLVDRRPTEALRAYTTCRVHLTVELRRRSRIDPVGMAVELASRLDRLGIPASAVRCQLQGLHWPAYPTGLCCRCWDLGRRTLSKPFLVHRRTLEFCPDHKAEWEDRGADWRLTPAP